MKKIKYILTILFIILLTGCDLLKRDTMEDITIITTIYPLEYAIDYLYGDSSIINSIYPDDTNVDEYTLTEKQIKDNSKKDLFIYLGNSNDANHAVTFREKNNDLKLINATFGMEYNSKNNSIEELWLNPSNLLMISQNIKNGLAEYINSTYLIKDIDERYEELKLELSELDADIKLTIENANKDTIFTNHKALKYLEKYGLTVYVLNQEEDIYEKNLTILNNYIQNGKVKYFYVLENTEISNDVQKLIDEKKILSETFRNLKNINDEERNSGTNYVDITKENIENLKKELY